MSVRLFIAGQEVELSNTTEVAVTKQIANVFNLENRQVDFTNRITLPVTETNIRVLELLTINGNSSDRPYKLDPARLEIDGVTYADRMVCLVDSSKQTFEIRLISNMFDFVKQ
jgi:hypothetical protein